MFYWREALFIKWFTAKHCCYLYFQILYWSGICTLLEPITSGYLRKPNEYSQKIILHGNQLEVCVQ